MKNVRGWFAGFLLVLCLFGASAPGAWAQDDAGGRRSTPEAHSPEAKHEVEDSNEQYRQSAVVKKLGAMMGMSSETAATTFEVLNFAVLALLVGGALVKILPKTFRDRTTGLQKQLVDARAATEEASVRMNSIEDRLAQLDGQIAAMRDQAEKSAVADEARFKAAVQEETSKIVAAAEAEISSATLQARRELQTFAAELAVEQAARKLVISAETDRLLVQGFASRLGGKAGQN